MDIRTERPPRIKPAMNRTDRAKQFAPFAALGSMDDVLAAVIRSREKEGIEHIQNLEDFNYFCAEDMDIEEIGKWQKDLN